MLLSTFVPALAVLGVVAIASLVPWNRLRPRRALWLSTGLCIAAGSAVAVTLAVLVGGFVLGLPPGRWLADACLAFVDHHRVPTLLGLGASAAGVVAAVRVHGVIVRRVRLKIPEEPLTVVTDERPMAFAVGGHVVGGVVVTTGMLDVLDERERRVLFAHERAHLDQRHDRFLLASALTTAIVPASGRLAAQVRLAAERCADEAAVDAVGGDRRLVARSIARAALAADAHAPAMAFTGSTVAHRVKDLIDHSTTTPHALHGTAAVVATGLIGSSAIFAHHLGELVVHICS